jgi:AraC-like DNA-binding protein
MISSKLPDIASFKESSPVLSKNTVISAFSNYSYYYPAHQTPYLFITNAINKGHYYIRGKHLALSERQFLLLNTNEQLSIRFDQDLPLHTLFILFEEQFFKDCLHYYFTNAQSLLDNPHQALKDEFWLPNIPYRLNQNLSAKASCFQYNHPWQQSELDAILFELIGDFLCENAETKKKINRIDVKKRETKEELYRRLTTLVDYMYSSLYDSLTLDEMAKIACLNKFHLLSVFKDLFHTTPVQFFRELKLQRAHELLQEQRSVSDVCYSLGFESIGSFSNLFKKHFRIPPSSILKN